jgi:hypothetical protein
LNRFVHEEDNMNETVFTVHNAHGAFASRGQYVNECMVENKYYLAEYIASAYDGSENPAFARPAYWLAKPKFELAVVAAGLRHPAN